MNDDLLSLSLRSPLPLTPLPATVISNSHITRNGASSCCCFDNYSITSSALSLLQTLHLFLWPSIPSPPFFSFHLPFLVCIKLYVLLCHSSSSAQFPLISRCRIRRLITDFHYSRGLRKWSFEPYTSYNPHTLGTDWYLPIHINSFFSSPLTSHIHIPYSETF